MQLSTVYHQRTLSICFLTVFIESHFQSYGSPSCEQADVPLLIPFLLFLCCNSALFPGPIFLTVPQSMQRQGYGTPFLFFFVTWGELSWFQPGSWSVNSYFLYIKASSRKQMSFAFFLQHNHYMLLVYLSFKNFFWRVFVYKIQITQSQSNFLSGKC